MDTIWPTQHREPLTIRATLGEEGLGVFALSRYGDDNALHAIGLRLAPPEGTSAGHTVFEISQEELDALNPQQLNLQLRALAGNPAQTAMPVFLQIEQPRGELVGRDAMGAELPRLAEGVRLDPDLPYNNEIYWSLQVIFQ